MLTPSELKPYILESRNIKNNSQGMVIPPNGVLKLKFEQIGAKNLTILLKRMNGSDGLISLNGKNYVLPPNLTQRIFINDFNLILDRSGGRLGNIIIEGLEIHSKEEKENIVMEGSWQDLLKKVTSMKGVTVTDFGVLANDGAEITGCDFISRIETDPPCCFTKTEDKIKFNYNCRIILIEKKDDFVQKTNYSKYSFDDLTKSIQNLPSYNSFALKVNEKKETISKNIGLTKPTEANNLSVVFALNKMNLSNFTKNSNSQQAGDSILLNWNGSLDLPLSDINNNTFYAAIIKCNRINGNGKLSASLVSSFGETLSTQTSICSNQSSDIYFSLSLPRQININESVFLRINRPQGLSSGDVLINSIKLCDQVDSGNRQESNIENKTSVDFGDRQESNIENKTSGFIIPSSPGIQRFGISKKKREMGAVSNSLIEKEYSTNGVVDYGLSFSFDFQDKEYFEMVKQVFTNIEDKKDSNIYIGSLDSLNNEKDIVWIDSFAEISDYKINILKKCNKIFLNSFKNIKDVKSFGLNCSYVPMFLPYIEILSFDSGVCSNFNSEHTDISNLSLNERVQTITNCTNYICKSINNHNFDPLIDMALKSGATVYSNNYSFINEKGFIFYESLDQIKDFSNEKRASNYNAKYNSWLSFSIKTITS